MEPIRLAWPDNGGVHHLAAVAAVDVAGIEPWKSLLLYSLVRCGGLKAVVEIGVYRGSTLVWLAQAIADHGRGGTVYAIEVHPYHIATAEVNIQAADLEDYVTWKEGDSSRMGASIPDGLDLVFVDGDHSYEGVKRDFEMFWPKLKEGGIMVFDDVISWPGCGDVWGFLKDTFPPERIFWMPVLPHPLRCIRDGFALVQKGRPAEYEFSSEPKVEL